MATGRITKRAVDAFQSEKNGDILWDDTLKGYGVKGYLTGRKVYLTQFRASGRNRRVTIGVHGPVTPDQARTEAARILAEVAAGRDPAETKTQAKAMPTVAELCGLYLDEGVATRKSSPLAIDRGRIERHIKPLLGRKRVDQVTRADVQRFMNAVAEGKTAADVKTGPRGRAIVTGGKGTATRCMGLLGAIFTFAVERGFRADNPTAGIRKFPVGKRERFLSAAELAQLGETLRAAEQEGVNSSAIAALRLLLLTGMRRGEVLGLQWAHVDFERACLRLPDSKTGAKVVHMGAAALELLAAQPRIQGTPFVFPGTIQGQALGGLPRIWQTIRKRAGLPDLRIHDLRHGFASIGVMGGMGLPIVGALLGHKTPSVTARYAHLGDDPLKLAADRISGTIAAALTGKPEPGTVVPLKNAR